MAVCGWLSILPNAQQMIEWNRPLSIKFMLFSAAAARTDSYQCANHSVFLRISIWFRFAFCAVEMRNEHVRVQRRPAAASTAVNFIELIFISFNLFPSGAHTIQSDRGEERATRRGDTSHIGARRAPVTKSKTEKIMKIVLCE